MEDSIDLRPYVAALFRYWWLILAAIALGLLSALIIYNTNQGTYRATALVAISEPNQNYLFDERIENTVEADLLLDSYPELALTDELLNRLVPMVSERTNGRINNVTSLRPLLSISRGSASRLMRLTVETDDPQLAADIVNLWAETFTTAISDIYRNPGGQTQFYQDQLARSAEELSATEVALAEFQARNRQGLLENEINSLSQLQVDYLSDQRTLRQALDDIRALQSQLMAIESPTVTYADQVVALTLQLNTYYSPTLTISNPLQLQISPGSDLTTSDRATQLQLLDALARTAESRLATAGAQLPAVEAQMLAVQKEYQAAVNEFDRLDRRREVAQETYLTVARKLDEARIAAGDAGSGVQIVGRAAAPELPERRDPLVLFGSAIALGLLLAVAVIFALTWWQLRAAGRS
jgi:uncharacterized protein involved in exopolysaccharide biosynthesis